ncbi:MAG: hypothetical protein QOF10_4046 [Kribbellaceae bacterium]|jgi:hypothetical protein|nr:hypothetical protein [Kribbellaceae bacterium]
MAVMGESSAAIWTDQLLRTGRAVFPLRRRRVLFRLALVAVFAINNLVSVVGRLLDQEHGVGWDIFGLISCTIFLPLIAVSVWQLITQRPVLTVDRLGIRIGKRKPGLGWSEIAKIGSLSGVRGAQVLPVIPKNVWANHLNVTQDNVKDLATFAHWLGELVEQHKSEVQIF